MNSAARDKCRCQGSDGYAIFLLKKKNGGRGKGLSLLIIFPSLNSARSTSATGHFMVIFMVVRLNRIKADGDLKFLQTFLFFTCSRPC